MKINAAGLLLCTFLVGCGGTAPFGEVVPEVPVDENGDPIGREGVPPGTTSPSPSFSIFRSEPTNQDDEKYFGNGVATGISYDGSNDTFTVDGLAFDGGNVYQRGTAVSSLNSGAFAVYEADQQFPDSLNTQPINQFTHRAIYGVSRNQDASGTPATQFAIVRTGAYRDFGFGGFIYQRSGSVTLPASGQALYNGSSAGLRDFSGDGGLQYSTANVRLAIDFDDFNETTGARGDGVNAVINNRRVFDINGNDITSDVVDLINVTSDANLSSIPAARFVIGPGVLDDNGDLVGEIDSAFVDNNGDVIQYETGNYYAIVSGDNAEEIVGVFVLENAAERDGVSVRDTSGFVVYRDTTTP